VSISPTFYEQLLHQNPCAKKLQTQIVSTPKLRKKLMYEKAACKILVKLIPGAPAVADKPVVSILRPMSLNFILSSLTNGSYKLECLPLAGLSDPV
jgi:hypothetical protein